jgi:lauroyl/myristoyl acyltransferase
VNNKEVRRAHWHKELRYRVEWLGVSLCAPIIPLLPLALLRLLADLAGWVAFHLDSKSRAVALANLQAAFGEERDLSDRERIARRSLQLFGRSFLKLFWSARLLQEQFSSIAVLQIQTRVQNEDWEHTFPVIHSFINVGSPVR